MASQQQKQSEKWGSRLAAGVKDAILDLVLDRAHYTPSQIKAKLTEQDDEYMVEHGGNRKFKRKPSLSAIERGVRLFRPKNEGETWRPNFEDSAQDARAILDVHGAVIANILDDGKKPGGGGLTNQWAEWILCAFKLAPGLKPYGVYLLARLMYIRDLGELDPEPLDVFLAMAPWTSPKASGQYYRAVKKGYLPLVPQMEQLELEILRDQSKQLKAELGIFGSPAAFSEFTDQERTETEPENQSEVDA